MLLLSVRRLLSTLAVLAALGGLTVIPPPQHAAPTKEAPGTLTGRSRSVAPAEKALAVGTEIVTGHGDRRRLRLPDGSTLYVNQKTTVRLTGRDTVTLTVGEVFVDVAPRKKGEPIVVKGPKRQITSQGTKFAARADDRGTAVVVASGRVKVSGLDAPVRAGQFLAANSEAPTPAPRVSHLLSWVRDLMPGSLVPTSQHAGGALVARDPNGQDAKLTLRRYHVDVYIEDGFARTTIDQTYFNSSSEQLEGTFYFPLPADASLSRLAMYVDGQRMEGGMAERDYARSVYETIRYTQRDPALLEWVDGSTFKMRVFPLEARKEKRLLLSYTQKLPALYGQQAYRFPAGHSLGKVAEWSFHARVKNGANLTYASPSHLFKMSKPGGDLVLDVAVKNATLDRDVVLDLHAARVADESASFSSMEQDGAKYLMLRYRPELRGEPVRQRRDWVFLVETSGDRDPLLMRTQIEVVRALLESAEPDDTFALLTANTRTRALSPTVQEVTPERIASAVAFLEGAHLIGALDIGRALNEAKPLLEAVRAPYLVHVGSGVASMGEKRADILASRLPKGARYVGVGVGRRWDRALMKVAAERTAGHFTQINPDEVVAWRGFELAATLNTPRLLDVKVTDKAERATFLPFVKAIAQGEEVTAVARVEGDLPKAVIVKGTLEGKEVSRELAVREVKDKVGHLPRTWARLEIERLLAADAQKNKAKIVALSKAMYVLTPFTSLLVLESEEMYVQFKVDRGRKDHWALYPAPPRIKVVYEPEDGEPAWKGKPSAKQVAETVLVRGRPSELGVGWRGGEREAIRRLAAMELSRRLVKGGVTDDEYFGAKLAAARFEMEETSRRQEYHAIKSSKERLFIEALNDSEAPQESQPRSAPSGGSPNEIVIASNIRTRQNVILRQLPLPPGQLLAWPDLKQAGRNLAQGQVFQAGTTGLTAIQDASLGSVLFSPDGRALASGVVTETASLLHERPSFSGNAQLFADLLRFAPGLNTHSADLLAALEAEARYNPASKPGTIDAGARTLFTKTSRAGWRSLTIPGHGERPAFTILFDAGGLYRYERTLSSGLRERVVCDGKTLWHAYPDLGLAARRSVSRFHRLDFAYLVPQALPAPEDLARGADLRLIAPNTVALVPHGAGTAKSADGKPRPYRQAQFVFADGRLSERQVVQMPARKLILRETYSAEGVVQRFGADGGELVTLKSVLKPTGAPTVKPDLRKLVVLDLPFRSRPHVIKRRKLEKTANEALRFDDARALLAADMAGGNGVQALITFRAALLARGQKEIGYYVLLAAAGVNLDSDNGDVLGEHPEEPLAHYLALHTSPVLRKHAAQWAAGSNVWPEGLLKRLATGHALTQRWRVPDGKAAGLNPATRPAERDRALGFVKRYKGDPLSWDILGLMQDRTAEAAEAKADVRATYKALAEAWQLFAADPALGLVARYEQARCLFKAGEGAAARKLFLGLHAEALKEKGLLRLDADFVAALRGEGGWDALMRQTATTLVKQKKRSAALLLAQQCWQLGEQALAQHVYSVALTDVPEGKERLPLLLTGLNFLMRTSQFAEADRTLRKLLSEPANAKRADLWRRGARLAEQRFMPARQLACLEKALELEQMSPAVTINLEQVRADYGNLLEQYGKLADALVTLELPAPAGFRAKVVRAADRWRALDGNAERTCQLAASTLRTLGERELAWDYLTTPAAQKPNEAEPWTGMAQTLKRFGDLPLADRAYQAAFEAEPTNAEFLWERAQNLRQMGRLAQARVLYRQVAESDWQPRFRGLKDQARWALER